MCCMYLTKLVIVTYILVCSQKDFAIKANSYCPTTGSRVPTFWGCVLRCHCKNDKQCEYRTGICENGCEFGWMGPACQSRNVAMYYNDTGQYVDTAEHIVSGDEAIDGDRKTCTQSNTTLGPGEQSWYIQFNKPYHVIGILITVLEEDVENFKSFRVETGDHLNETNFPTLCKQESDGITSGYYEIMCLQPSSIQQLRIRMNVTDIPLRLCEVEIYGGRSIAFNKPSTQSTTHGLWSAYRAVDGLVDRSCSATIHSVDPWWRVDLGTQYVIHEVVFSGQGVDRYFQGFHLLLGTNETSYTDLYQAPITNDSQRYHPLVIDIRPPATGRYLQIQLFGRSELLSICEVLVFAECPKNKCGLDCSRNCFCSSEITGTHELLGLCPHGCLGRWTGVDEKCDQECQLTEWGTKCENLCGHCEGSVPCNVTTGVCSEGCSGPWIPPLCTEACPDFKYGTNCALDCGICMNNTPCNITDGTCLGGCQPGWKPPTCHELYTDFKYRMDCAMNCEKCRTTNDSCNSTDVPCHVDTCRSDWQPLMLNAMFPGMDNTNPVSSLLDTQGCGMCKNNSACNSSDGTCVDGCEPGWEPPSCQRRVVASCFSIEMVGVIAGSCGAVIVVLMVIILALIHRHQAAFRRHQKLSVRYVHVEASRQTSGQVPGRMPEGTSAEM